MEREEGEGEREREKDGWQTKPCFKSKQPLPLSLSLSLSLRAYLADSEKVIESPVPPHAMNIITSSSSWTFCGYE